MLPVLIFLSVLVLIGAFWAARSEPHPVRWGVFAGFALPTILLPMLAGFFPTVVLVLAACLEGGLRIWPTVRPRVRTFLPFAGLAVVVAYGLACAVAMNGVSRSDGLREKYRYESMEDRVPAPARLGPPVAAPDDRRYVRLEELLAERRNGTRERMLRQLHEERVQAFASSPGFGVARILQPAEWGLRLRDRPDVPDQPAPAPPPATAPSASISDEPDLLLLHDAGTLDFVNPLGFGFVKDRQHVAGFQSHAFTEVPDPTPRWHVERLELIGLLLYPEPVAYVSEKLPAMDELRGAPIRRLDAFETEGLEALLAGQTLYFNPAGDRPRMLGAVRNVRQCVGCHGGERGDLLGAFSYTLGSGP